MNTRMAAKPHITLSRPLAMLSAPRLGPMAVSSMNSIGAASAPERSSSARSLASEMLCMPVISKRLSSWLWIVGAVMTWPLPFSNSTIAMRLPMLSPETVWMMLAPFEFIVRVTTAPARFWSWPGWASDRSSPLTTTSLLTMMSPPSRYGNLESPNGTGPVPAVAALASALSSSMCTSSVAVRPIRSRALAVSWMPGSSTTMRSAPCFWITGSEVPRPATRLASVVMFCWIASSCALSRAAGLSEPVSLTSSPSVTEVHCTSGKVSVSRLRPCVAAPCSWKVAVTVLPSRVTAGCSDFSRISERVSEYSVAIFLSSAAFRSTCSRKCTPPRRSRPRYIGLALSAVSQRGARATRFSETA